MSTPTVSVVLPTYNRADLLPRAIDSVIEQTFDDWELILIDDGSTDGTDAVVAEYRRRLGERLVCFRQERGGCGAARNRGIDAARGQYVAFLDSDDAFLPSKLERQLALFRLQPELGLVYSDYAYVDLAGGSHDSAFENEVPLARRVLHEEVAPGLCVCTGDFFGLLLQEYFIATIVGMVRRDVLENGPRWRTVPSYAEEWLFFLKVARACRTGFVNEPLSLHYYTSGSITRTDAHRNNLRLRKLLRAMPRELHPLRRRHRRTVRRNLARVCRQLAYDAFRADEHATAARHFIEAFRNQPDPRLLYNTLQCLTRHAQPPSLATIDGERTPTEREWTG